MIGIIYKYSIEVKKKQIYLAVFKYLKYNTTLSTKHVYKKIWIVRGSILLYINYIGNIWLRDFTNQK